MHHWFNIIFFQIIQINIDPMVPGPGAYNAEPSVTLTKKHSPAFSIQGIRKEKSHVLGPFATF